MKPTISIIVAIDEERGIGKDNKLMWHISEDLQRFKKITAGHAVIMGRKTFESIGRPLPNRTNIIVSRDTNYKTEGCIVVHSLEEARAKAKEVEHDEIFIIGGAQIFEQALPITEKLYLTLVKGTYNADTFFPDYSMFTTVLEKEEHTSDNHSYTFLTLEK